MIIKGLLFHIRKYNILNKFLKQNIKNFKTNKLMSTSSIMTNDISKNKNHIVWVDLEMSGLEIDTEHILEMAILM
jgi:hypothetical protein